MALQLAPIAQSDDEFRHFFNQSLDLLCVASLDGYFKQLNPAWTKHLEWTTEELLAKPFLDFVHPDDRDATQAELGKLAGGADTIFFENRYRHRDGSYLWLRWNARPVPGRRRIYAIARDVTRQKRLEEEILRAVDQEKERMGREMHDGLCQTLAGISALSSTLSKKLSRSADPAASAAAAEIATLLNETIADARDMAHGLGPLDLGKTGLHDALEALTINVQHMFGISCTLVCDWPDLLHRGDTELHLYRIVQEAVNNAVTHGQADQIDIILNSKDRQGFLSVSDNGIGLPEDGAHSDGVGVQTMIYRARLIRGSVELRRLSHGGTVVTCKFPLPEIRNTREDPDNAGSKA